MNSLQVGAFCMFIAVLIVPVPGYLFLVPQAVLDTRLAFSKYNRYSMFGESGNPTTSLTPPLFFY